MTSELTSHYDHNQQLQTIIGEYLEAIDVDDKATVRRVFLARHPTFGRELREFFNDEDRTAGLLFASDDDDWDDNVPEVVPYFGKYVDLELIGKGGMGIVYKATQKELNCIVALKMMRDSNPSADAIRRFRHEMEFVARLRHPNIVSIREVGVHEGAYFYTMDFVDGKDLSKQVPFPPDALERAARLLAELSQAVDFAHQHGILHRDLKPANVLIDANGKPCLTDFGLAKWIDRDNSTSSRHRVVGSLPYMAPEHFDGRDSTIRTDVYGLGAIFYCILTGQAPFVATTPIALIHKIATEEPSPPHHVQEALARGANRDLETICLKCLRKDPRQRYDTAADLAHDLQRWLGGEPIVARPTGPIERACKWVKRHPATSALVGLGFAAIVTIMLMQLFYSHRLETVNQDLVASNEIAEQRRRDMRAMLYDTQMNLAGRAWEEAQIHRVRELLQGSAPGSTDGKDLRGWEWYYLDRLCDADLMTLEAHDRSVNGIAYSPDGTKLASGGADGLVRVWDVERGAELATLDRHIGAVTSLAFHPGGNWLASAGADTIVRVWNLENGTVAFSLAGHILSVTSVAFRPDGKRLASASSDGTVRIWDVATGRQLQVLQGHTDAVRRVAYSRDGQRLATAGQDGTIRIWNDGAATATRVLKGSGSPVLGVVFHPQSARVASISDDKTLKVWDLNTGQQLVSVEGPASTFADVDFSPDGKRLATAGLDHTVRVWDAATGKSVGVIKGHTAAVNAVAFRADGKVLASAGGDGSVKLWSPEPIAESRSLEGHVLRVTSVAFSPDGQRLASGSYDMSVKIWDLASGSQLRSFGEQEIERVPSQGGGLGPIRSIATRSGHASLVTAVAFSPDGQRVASAGFDSTVRIWRVASGEELLTLKHGGQVTSVAFSPDGRYLASGSWDDLVNLWDAATGQRLRTLPGHAENVTCVAFSPDGKRLASASEDRTVRIWDTISDETHDPVPVLTLRGHTDEVTCVAYSRQGDRLATASDDQTVRIWDATQGTLLLTLQGHTGSVRSVAFSPDGTRLASAGQSKSDRFIRVWDTRTGQETASLAGTEGVVHCLAFSPDGGRLAAGAGSTIRLWDATHREKPAPRVASSPRAGAAMGSQGVAPGGGARLKALGFFWSKALPDSQRPGKFLGAGQPGTEYLVVVVSVPLGPFIPSQDEYRAMEADAAKDRESHPLGPRYCLCVYRPGRFHVRLGSGQGSAARLLGRWPIELERAGGFVPGTITLTSSKAIEPDERSMFALAFAIPAHERNAPAQIQFDDDEWVAVPHLVLEPPPGAQPQ